MLYLYCFNPQPGDNCEARTGACPLGMVCSGRHDAMGDPDHAHTPGTCQFAGSACPGKTSLATAAARDNAGLELHRDPLRRHSRQGGARPDPYLPKL